MYYRTDMDNLKQEQDNSQDNGRSLHPMLAADAGSLRKFVWVGWSLFMQLRDYCLTK